MTAAKKAPEAPPAGWHETTVVLTGGQSVPAQARASRAFRVDVAQDRVRARPEPGQDIGIGGLAATILAVEDPGGRGETWSIVAATTGEA